MSNWHIEPLIGLSDRFSGEAWERAVVLAERENEWFTVEQMLRAVEALKGDMLTRESLEAWISGYQKPEARQERRIGIVMAGNLPLVGFADLAAVIAVGDKAIIKPSSKDRALMGFVVRELQQLGCDIEVVAELEAKGLDGVIATGGDAARDAFRGRFGEIPNLIRGARQSVAVLTGGESEQELRGLADDMFSYWGLGCRSIVRLFVPRGYDIARLSQVMATCAPAPHATYAECYRYARAMAAMGSEKWSDVGFFLFREVSMDAGSETPKLAEVLYSEYYSEAEVTAWLSQHERALQCVAGSARYSFPRRVALGQTQSPQWHDYADGVDTVKFLLELT